jgi:AcrR family transcriptional regulator
VRPGGHQLRPEVLAHHQRRRIIDGAAAVIAARGYREVSVADIVRSAAIARGRFYEHFASKEDCFFALYEEGTAAALAAVHKGCGSAGGGDFGGRLEAGLAALLAYLEANPEMARCCIVEGPAVGAAIGGRFEATISGFADLLREAREATGGGEGLPGTVEETVVGGLYWLLYYALLERRPKRIGRLLPQLSDFASIPFATATPHEGAALHP